MFVAYGAELCVFNIQTYVDRYCHLYRDFHSGV